MGAYLSAVLADNPLHYWRAADPGGNLLHDIGSSPMHMHGVGAPILGYSGPVADGGCIDCTLDGAYANVGLATSVPVNPITIELWVWMFQHTTITRQFFQPCQTPQISIYATSTLFGFIYNDASFGTVHNYTPQAWHHLVGVFGSGLATMYVDGALTGSGAIAAMSALTGFYELGTNQVFSVWGGAFYAEIAVYSAALSGARVAAHFAAADQVAQPPVYSQAGGFSSTSGSGAPNNALLGRILNDVEHTYPA